MTEKTFFGEIFLLILPYFRDMSACFITGVGIVFWLDGLVRYGLMPRLAAL